MIKLIVAVKGSAKSGNRGHAGRKGKVGGSAPKGSASSVAPWPVADLADDMSGKVDALYAQLPGHSDRWSERKKALAADKLGVNLNDYERQIYQGMLSGGDESRELGNMLREYWFGEDYGAKVYNGTAPKDVIDTINRLADRPRQPLDIYRVVSSEPAIGQTLYSDNVPRSWSTYGPVTQGSYLLKVKSATHGTRVSVYSQYPQEAEMVSRSPRGYKVVSKTEHEGWPTYELEEQ